MAADGQNVSLSVPSAVAANAASRSGFALVPRRLWNGFIRSIPEICPGMGNRLPSDRSLVFDLHQVPSLVLAHVAGGHLDVIGERVGAVTLFRYC